MSDMHKNSVPTHGIPFVLGATGHRDLVEADLPKLRQVVRGLLERMQKRMHPTSLLILSGLAEGADQLIADEALKCGAYLGAVLPMPREIYRTTMTEEGQRKFDCLIEQASLVKELKHKSTDEELQSEESHRAEQYRELAKYLALHCQGLIALWDGEIQNGAGGTAEVVRLVLAGVEFEDRLEPVRGTVYHIYARRSETRSAMDRPFHLRVMRRPSDSDEYAKAVPLWSKARKGMSLERAMVEEEDAEVTLREMNQWVLEPKSAFWNMLAAQSDQPQGFLARIRHKKWQQIVEPWLDEAGLVSYNREASIVELPASGLKTENWDAPTWPYLERLEESHRRSDVLAQHGQQRRLRFLTAILIMAFLAAVALESHSEGFIPRWLPENFAWFAFPLCIYVALCVYRWAAWYRVEDRFLDSRVLSEALRVQFFWELGGVREPVWKHYLTLPLSELSWVSSALRALSLFDAEQPGPAPAFSHDAACALENWVRHQASWYSRTSEKQRRACQTAENWSVIVLIAIFSLSALLGLCLAFHVFELQPKPEKWVHWGFAVSSVALGLFKVYLDQQGFDEQARNYRRLGHLFAHWTKVLAHVLRPPAALGAMAAIAGADSVVAGAAVSVGGDQPVPHQAIKVLYDAGVKALEENSIWLIMHREHPMKVSAGS